MEPSEKRPRGRPPGPPSRVMPLRIPEALLERLDRYIDSELVWSHDSDINHASIMRTLIEGFLESKGRPHPENHNTLSGQIWGKKAKASIDAILSLMASIQ